MSARGYRWLIVFPLLALALLCAACGTVHGLGEDVQDAGKGIQTLSDDTRDAISP